MIALKIIKLIKGWYRLIDSLCHSFFILREEIMKKFESLNKGEPFDVEKKISKFWNQFTEISEKTPFFFI